MDSTPDIAPTPTPPPVRARKAAKTSPSATPRTGRLKSTRRPRVQHTAKDQNVEPPFMSIDAEVLADLQEFSTRKLRAMVRDQPLLFVGGALATGFVVGGGWRTRVGRMIVLAAARYAALQAAERYFNV